VIYLKGSASWKPQWVITATEKLLPTVHAPESRTSSPVCIPRDPISMEHVTIKGLYPCGEGAGYAGGIVSAALDGIKSADTPENIFVLKQFINRNIFYI